MFIISSALFINDRLNPFPDLFRGCPARFDDARIAHHYVTELEEGVATEEAREHRNVPGVRSFHLGAGRAGLDVGSDQEFFRKWASAK
ncbi:hypothetical protein VUN82_03000 [Micrococcaceae bacterium Sec5.1]